MKKPELKLPDLKLPDWPKPVAISVTVIAASVLALLLLAPTLGAARNDAQSDVLRLRSELTQAQQNLRQAKDDYDFVVANRQRFESLMKSDKLIPHTRRTAIRQMQALALEFDITALNYSFQAVAGLAPEAALTQPQSGLYRVNVESVELTIGAPLDQSVYMFMAEIHENFPGSMVISELELERAQTISQEALTKVSRGEDSGLVKGKIKYTWRTAQQNKQDEKK